MGTESRNAVAPSPRSSDWDAATYDRLADPMTRWGKVVLERLPLQGYERVLDAGCGSGRVTEHLCRRLPGGTIVALDLSSAMLLEAKRKLAPFRERVTLVRADLAQPLPLQSVDAVFSTATVHWVRDHDALFANLAAVLRPGGALVAQCGGAGNIKRVYAAARQAGVDLDPTHFASPADTERRLNASGFADVRCWLHHEPTTIAPGAPLVAYLRTVCLRQHVEMLSADDRDPFVREVAQRLGEPVIDYVRLNITARRV